jgi:SAM-dependent methyltransferase
MNTAELRFDRLVDEALMQAFEGWDFEFLDDRLVESELPWNYPNLAVEKIKNAQSLLDMGTGGGELLSTFAPFPGSAFATEAYLPNIEVAGQRLRALHVPVVGVEEEERKLPFCKDTFDLVLNRHESYWPSELYRILVPGGNFLTQQVGGRDHIQLNQVLQSVTPPEYAAWTCDEAAGELEEAGFELVRKEESLSPAIFKDIGAVVFLLKIISWQIPDFSVERYHKQLFQLHLHIEKEGGFRSDSHRFLIEARKPV